jgi:predicted nucleic acid-binding Zn ribbon protein
MKVKSTFCPICGTHHDPEFPCADRAGELLRESGLEPKPMDKGEFKKTVKRANRSMIILAIVVAGLILLTILIAEFISNK